MFMAKQLTSNYKSSQKACATLSSLLSTLIQLADTSMSTEHSTALSSGSTGLGCTLISRKCAGHAQVAPSQTAPNGNPLSSSIHFPSKPLSESYTLMVTMQVNSRDSKGASCILLHAVECALLPSWNQSINQTPQPLRQQS